MNRKKFHHFLHDGYLKAWRMPTTIYVYDLRERKSFDKTGRDVGGEGKFNVFSFDQTVIDLLRYTFAERAHRDESGGVYRLMLGFIDFMKDFDYQHKSDNLLEDFYGEFETRIGKALKLVEDGEQLILNETHEAFDSLVFFFCLQLFRTPKIRRLLSDEMVAVYYANEQLEAQQKAISRCTFSSQGWRWPWTSWARAAGYGCVTQGMRESSSTVMLLPSLGAVCCAGWRRWKAGCH
jgi:hypothetical protein